jgi:uncharacterized protein (TIGR03435 family)
VDGFAQSTEYQRSFEAVYVKPSRDAFTGSDIDNEKHLRGKKLHTAEADRAGLCIGAYRVEGPGWLGSERFDVNAKLPTDVPAGGQKADAAFRAMVQNMLTNRFRLVVRRSQKTFPVYGLVVAKRGLKVNEVKQSGTDSCSHNNHYSGTSITIANFAEFLSGRGSAGGGHDGT